VGQDEHRYPVIARDMLERGEYLLPYFQGHVHLAKPPLTYWAIVLGYKLCGENPWGARLPNALAFAVTVALVFLLGKELWDEERGKQAALFYLAMLVPFAAANVVTTDTLLVMWETAALWAFVKGLKTGKERWFVLMWLFWALGFLTKGTAILPVAAGTFLFWWIRRRELPRPFSPAGLGLFALVAFPWYVYVWSQVPGALKTFWLEQVYGRLFSDVFHRNSKWYAPFYLYLPLLTLGALPASGVWFRAVRRFSWPRVREAFRKEWPCLFLATQLAVPLLVFCIAKSRLPLYILPLFVPLALMTARILPRPVPMRAFLPWFALLEGLKWASVYLVR